MQQVPTQGIANWVEKWSIVSLGGGLSRGGKSYALENGNQLS